MSISDQRLVEPRVQAWPGLLAGRVSHQVGEATAIPHAAPRACVVKGWRRVERIAALDDQRAVEEQLQRALAFSRPARSEQVVQPRSLLWYHECPRDERRCGGHADRVAGRRVPGPIAYHKLQGRP